MEDWSRNLALFKRTEPLMIFSCVAAYLMLANVQATSMRIRMHEIGLLVLIVLVRTWQHLDDILSLFTFGSTSKCHSSTLSKSCASDICFIILLVFVERVQAVVYI